MDYKESDVDHDSEISHESLFVVRHTQHACIQSEKATVEEFENSETPNSSYKWDHITCFWVPLVIKFEIVIFCCILSEQSICSNVDQNIQN